MRILVSEAVEADVEELRRLIEEAFAGIDASGVELRVERARNPRESFTGRAYPEPPRRPKLSPGTLFFVRLRLPGALRNRGYPRAYRYTGLVTAPWITVRDWRERLVALAAHEAFHVHQFREGLRRSEVAAERWALKKLLEWSSVRAEALRPAAWRGIERTNGQLMLFAS
ncbi:MAG TPA: hypothetical protein VHI54_05360 [Actinomycetota bacterium]|nr:hypothetical protein [Actinomycetota bacterium]